MENELVVVYFMALSYYFPEGKTRKLRQDIWHERKNTPFVDCSGYTAEFPMSQGVGPRLPLPAVSRVSGL